ncbi:FoF1 ATP synthase subunit gamma [Marivita sp. GX14005]|uniref:F0F1 ATP synthase subunit gamma n=1 Tax=Marivita sp. GX14005 TaxID=2942276 RepID=UPI0020184CA6|nr:FoF1 ATP synthase subunit gamma [Marivita sp. GX14005]MCL3882933.1 F0F1 ATP synthase subunit gamma [Marivita sp. GX14005]
MTQTLEQLTRRGDTMQSIRGIVRTMKTMSAINALPYEEAADAIGDYRRTVLAGLHAHVLAHGPLPQAQAGDAAPVMIAFGSDHGLCGNYNETVAARVLRAVADAPARVLCVGARMEDALSAEGIVLERVLMPPASADGLGRLAGRAISALDDLRGAPDAPVALIFMQRGDHGRQAPALQRLLPFDPDLLRGFTRQSWASRSLPFARMAPAPLLAALIRGYLFAEIFHAAAEALVTENAARLARMQQAERSIDERLEGLTGDMRMLRQSEITTELMDVIIGFEALKHDRRGARRNIAGGG